MYGIYFILPTLLVIIVSMIIVRVGAVALMMTGMDFEKAKFQALSAFSGTGFTTRDAEHVVNNITRRKMILGNAGIVTVIVTATSTFSQASGEEIGLNILVLLLGLMLIYILAKNSPLTKHLEKFIRVRLSKLEIFDDETTVDELLHIAEGYGVVRIRLVENSELINQSIFQINETLEHSFVLGIEKDEEWLPKPNHDEIPVLGNYLVIYGKLKELKNKFDK